MTIASALLALNTQRENLAINLSTKGVASLGTETLAQLVPKVLDITSGGTPTEGWQPPSDWIDIDNVVDGNINLLVADTTLATYAFICTTSTGQYHVDWGDGTSNNYDSGATAQHTYAVGTGQPCSRGYTTFKIVINSVVGNITRFYATNHTLAKRDQEHGYLWCVYGATYTTSLQNAFYKSTSPYFYCRMLESFKCLGSLNLITDTSNMFNTCNSLQSVNINAINTTITTNMFNNCYSLQSVDVSNMNNVTSANFMFNNCYSLQSVDVSNMVKANIVALMFNNCYSLQSVDVSNMVKADIIDGMFTNCYSLQSLTATNLGLNATSVDGENCFMYCEQITTISLPNAKLIKISAKGSSGRLNKLETLIFSPLSKFGGTSPQIDIAYNTLTASQLNTIFTSLPTLTGKTITITGCTGASTCDRTIATAKGWTVTG